MPYVDVDARRADRSMAIEVDADASYRRSPRTRRRRARDAPPRLLAVLAFPDTDELEVHLILDGRRTIGRAAGVARARRRGRGDDRRGARARRADRAARHVGRGARRATTTSACSSRSRSTQVDEDDDACDYGLAAGASPIDAAARSTLDALNRQLSRVL